jgi:hypothetical protein
MSICSSSNDPMPIENIEVSVIGIPGYFKEPGKETLPTPIEQHRY